MHYPEQRDCCINTSHPNNPYNTGPGELDIAQQIAHEAARIIESEPHMVWEAVSESEDFVAITAMFHEGDSVGMMDAMNAALEQYAQAVAKYRIKTGTTRWL